MPDIDWLPLRLVMLTYNRLTGRFSDLQLRLVVEVWGMRKLVRQIKRELKTAEHCAVYEEELSRVWPDDGKPREPLITQFAENHGLRLRFYRHGLCAIFDKEPRKRG